MSSKAVDNIKLEDLSLAPFRYDPLRINFGGDEVLLPRYRGGQGSKCVSVLAGVHGREHSGIWLAHRLLSELSRVELQATIEIVTIASPMSFRVESRLSPEDNHNLGECFGLKDPASITQVVGNMLTQELASADLVIDLHAAGEARYLPHVIVRDPELIDWAASLGFHFVICRHRTREGTETNSLSALSDSQRGFIVEAGGGISVNPQDIDYSLERLLSFLAQEGFIGLAAKRIEPTPDQRRYRQDQRQLYKAAAAGAFYPDIRLGEHISIGKAVGTWIPFKTLRPERIIAQSSGRLIYQRIRCWSQAKDTLFMTIPDLV